MIQLEPGVWVNPDAITRIEQINNQIYVRFDRESSIHMCQFSSSAKASKYLSDLVTRCNEDRRTR